MLSTENEIFITYAMYMLRKKYRCQDHRDRRVKTLQAHMLYTNVNMQEVIETLDRLNS